MRRGDLPDDDVARSYGTDHGAVEDLVRENPDWDAPLHPRLPYRGVQVVWGVRYEMARDLEDVLARRTRSLILDARAALEAAPAVARLMAQELGRDASWVKAQVRQFETLARGYLLSEPPSGS